MAECKFNETFDFTDVTSGRDFASRIFSPETIAAIYADNEAFFAADPEYADYFIGMFALNQAHFHEGPLYRDYAGLLKAATVLRGVIDSEYYLDTDVEAGDSFCGSPWQEMTDNPQNYAAIIARFDMETDECEIKLDEFGGKMEGFRGSCLALRDNGIAPSVIVDEIVDHLLDEDRLMLNAEYIPALKAFREELLSN